MGSSAHSFLLTEAAPPAPAAPPAQRLRVRRRPLGCLLAAALAASLWAGAALALQALWTGRGAGPAGLTAAWTERRFGVTWEVAGPIGRPDMEWLASTGANGIVQMPFPRQLRADEPAIEDPDLRVWGQRERGLRRTARLAREFGIATLLKPHLAIVDRSTGFWPGDIAMRSLPDWQEWFRNYRAMILRYATIAAEEGMEAFCVGAELRRSFWFEKEWREIIADVRRVYPGAVMYSVNWDDYEEFPFADAVDVIGVQAYFPLAYGRRPTRHEIKVGWEHALRAFEKWVAKVGKPIVFTEVGFHSCQGSLARPWEWFFTGMPVDFSLQADAYDVTLEVLRPRPWLRGLYFWKWLPGHPKRALPSDDDFHPQGKPAEDVLRRHFLEERLAPFR